MSTIIRNAAPLANLQGIQDVSGRAPVFEPEVRPTHLPHVYLFAEKGPTLPQMASGDSFNAIYGVKTLDPRSPYFNHQSAIANIFQGEGNATIVQRVVPEDAGPPARLLLSVDIINDAVAQFQRAPDGTFARDSSGNKIPVTGAGATLPGHKLKWVLNDWEDGSGDPEAFGEVGIKVGSLVNATSDQSSVYPILELEANFIGGYGDNLGLRLVAPTTQMAAALNDTLAEAVGAYLYRLSLVSRADAASTAVVTETLMGEQSIEFTFKPGAIDTKLDMEVSLEDMFMASYQDLDQPGFPPQYGPFGRIKIYQDNLEAVLAMIGAVEAPRGLLPEPTMSANSEYLHYVNPFTGVTFNGVPYYTLDVLGPLDGGIAFNENTTLYAAGGSDGTMDFDTFDELVRTQLLNYGTAEADLLDWAKYPQSIIYDTGFTLDTKFAMLTPIGKRKDIAVVLSTQDISQPQNTPAQESSIAISLRTAARNYPESELYGTSVCRAAVMGHSGQLISSKYKGPQDNLLPLTIELGQKLARYMGAGNGVWRAGLGPDLPENNRVTMFRNVNASFKSASVRNKDWDNGLIWVQNYDRRDLFIPALQTVYADDSSVLNSVITMLACVELNKVAQRTWRDLTGISNLTEDQHIERSNALIAADVEGRFDGRFTIVPETFFTAKDKQRGYSWSTKIHLYADNMRTVGSFTVTAHRRSDLEQQAA